MTWNSAPEFVSLLFISVLLINVQRDKSLPTPRNILFQWILKVAFAAIIISIVNLYVVIFSQHLSNWIVHLINVIFYIITPFLMVLMTFYIIAYLYEDQEEATMHYRKLSLPFCSMCCWYYLIHGMGYSLISTKQGNIN